MQEGERYDKEEPTKLMLGIRLIELYMDISTISRGE
jgi:hypothetical protein